MGAGQIKQWSKKCNGKNKKKQREEEWEEGEEAN